jgi:uncharacterized protein YggE
MKTVRIAALAALVLVAAAIAGAGRPEPAQGDVGDSQADNRLTVNGTGAVTTTPNQAELAFGVVSDGQSARAALAANGTAARRITTALGSSGIAASDIQTQQVSLSPRYAENNERIVGYTAQTTVSATLRNLSTAAAVIDAAVAAGANTVSGPALTRTDAGALYRNALEKAVADARSKAGALADAANVDLGAISTVVEAGSSQIPFAEKAAAAGAAPSIEPGTQQIEATVTVTFEIS